MYPQVWPPTVRLSPRTFIFWSCFTEGISLVLLSVFNVESSFGFSENFEKWSKKWENKQMFMHSSSSLGLLLLSPQWLSLSNGLSQLNCIVKANRWEQRIFITSLISVFQFLCDQSHSSLYFHYEHYIHPLSDFTPILRHKWCGHLNSLMFHFFSLFCILYYRTHNGRSQWMVQVSEPVGNCNYLRRIQNHFCLSEE